MALTKFAPIVRSAVWMYDFTMSDLDSVAADAFITVLKRLSPSQRIAVLDRILSDEMLSKEVAEALAKAGKTETLAF
jgi:hypothetical protein